MNIRTFKRYEKKYLVTEENLKKLIPLIENYMEPDEYCLDGNRYSIYNIYYDDSQNNIIRHSLSKPYYKEKLRMRGYEPFTNLDNEVFLELKKKIGGIVSKRRATMTLKEAIEFTQYQKLPKLKKYIDNQVCAEILCFLKRDNVKPAAHISYNRIAYFGKENKEFRLTFDTDIKARNADMFSDDDSGDIRLLEKGHYIMEIKILNSVPLWLAEAMSELGIRRIRFSKYGMFFEHFILPERAVKTQTAQLSVR